MNNQTNIKIKFEIDQKQTLQQLFNKSKSKTSTTFFDPKILQFSQSKSFKDLQFRHDNKQPSFSFGYCPRMFDKRDNERKVGPGKYNHNQLFGSENNENVVFKTNFFRKLMKSFVAIKT